MAQRVQLGTRRLPNTTSLAPIDFQTKELAGIVRSESSGSSFFFVGHSMGGLLSRNLVLSPDASINTAGRVAGIVTVVTPNRGAPVTAQARKYDPRTNLGLIEGFIHTIRVAKFQPLVGLLDAIVAAYVRDKLDKELFSKLNEAAKGLNTPGAEDLKPTSPTIQRLGGTSDSRPHAAVWGTVPQRYSWARIAASREFRSPESQVRDLQKGRSKLRVCRKIFYNAIIKTGTGKACATGDRAIGGFDKRWKEWTHFSGSLTTPTDGLLPEETLRYPLESDPAKQLPIRDEDHFSVLWRTPGVKRIGDGMLVARMRPVTTTSPPPSQPPPPGGCSDPSQIVCNP